MKKIIVLLVFTLCFSIGNAQSDDTETTTAPIKQQIEEIEQVKKKVEKSKSDAKKAEKEAKELKKAEQLKKQYVANEKSITKKEKQVEKLERQLEKGKLKGTLSPVDIQITNEKLAKIKMKIVNDQQKLNRIKRKI